MERTTAFVDQVLQQQLTQQAPAVLQVARQLMQQQHLKVQNHTVIGRLSVLHAAVK